MHQVTYIWPLHCSSSCCCGFGSCLALQESGCSRRCENLCTLQGVGTSDVHGTGGCNRAQTHAQRVLPDAGVCSAHGSRGGRAAVFRLEGHHTHSAASHLLAAAVRMAADRILLQPAPCAAFKLRVALRCSCVVGTNTCDFNSRSASGFWASLLDMPAWPAGKVEDTVTDSEQTLHTLLTVLSDFLQDVKVACRRYTDDLLEACLELMLAAPAAVMPAQVCACTCAFLQAC